MNKFYLQLIFALLFLAQHTEAQETFTWSGTCPEKTWTACCQIGPQLYANNWGKTFSNLSTCGSIHPKSLDTAIIDAQYDIPLERVSVSVINSSAPHSLTFGGYYFRVATMADFHGPITFPDLGTSSAIITGLGKIRFWNDVFLDSGNLEFSYSNSVESHANFYHNTGYLSNYIFSEGLKFHNYGNYYLTPTDSESARFNAWNKESIFYNRGNLYSQGSPSDPVNDIRMNFYDYGNIFIQGGELALHGSSTTGRNLGAVLSGNINMSTNTTLRFIGSQADFNIEGASITGDGLVETTSGANLFINTPLSISNFKHSGNATLHLNSDLTVQNNFTFKDSTLLSSESGQRSTLNIDGSFNMQSTGTISGEMLININGNTNCQGRIQHTQSENASFYDFGPTIKNNGIFDVNSGCGFYNNNLVIDRISFFENNNLISKTTSGTSEWDGMTVINHGNIKVANGNLEFGSLIQRGEIECSAPGLKEIYGKCYAAESSLTKIKDSLIKFGLGVILKGVFKGRGTAQVVSGNFLNEGLLTPGNLESGSAISSLSYEPYGNLSITGNYVQKNNGTLELDIGNGTNRDNLSVSGKAALGGLLVINLQDDAATGIGAIHKAISYSTKVGSFDDIAVAGKDFNTEAVIVYKNTQADIALVSKESPVLFGAQPELYAGSKGKVNATTTLPGNTQADAASLLDFVSSNTSVATINKAGIIEARSSGTVTIKAYRKGTSELLNSIIFNIGLPPLNPTISRISQSTKAEASDRSEYASLSDNRRFVAFASEADNLVDGDDNFTSDIFLKDRLTDKIKRINTNSAGQQTRLSSSYPLISRNGRFVAYISNDPGIATGDLNSKSDVILFDIENNSSEIISKTNSGTQFDTEIIGKPAISSEGRYIAFATKSDHLGNTSSYSQILIRDRQLNSTLLVTSGINGGLANRDSGVDSLSMSADGRFLSFSSLATNLIPDDTNGRSDIFLYDLSNNTIERINLKPDGSQSTSGVVGSSSISDNGNYIAFYSTATDLTTTPSNTIGNIFLRNRLTQNTLQITKSFSGGQTNGKSDKPIISGNGKYILFNSKATNLTQQTISGSLTQLYSYNIETGVIDLISKSSNLIPGDNNSSSSEAGFITSNGCEAVFPSEASNLISRDENYTNDIFSVRNTIINNVNFDICDQCPNDPEHSIAPCPSDNLLPDFDQNCLVDGADYLIWQRGFGTVPANFANGDANFDRKVDAADYTIWRDNYGATNANCNYWPSAIQDSDAPAINIPVPQPDDVSNTEKITNPVEITDNNDIKNSENESQSNSANVLHNKLEEIASEIKTLKVPENNNAIRKVKRLFNRFQRKLFAISNLYPEISDKIKRVSMILKTTKTKILSSKSKNILKLKTRASENIFLAVSEKFN